jgi:pullulanase/glycogen debranching enzyme
MQHLKDLAAAGLTHIHLLPVFDIATIEENKALREEPDWEVLETYPMSSTLQQAAVDAVRDQDGFNWGYDPYHYTAPEGSYSTNPEGPTRIIEFRQMVQALNGSGLRVVMDVVYNHTNSSGQDPKSVLDRRRRDQHLLPEHRHRARHDGKADDRLAAHLGHRIQGRRLSLRPDGPPHEG